MNKSSIIRASLHLFCKKIFKDTRGLRKWKRIDFRRNALPEMFTERYNDVYDLPEHPGLPDANCVAILAYAGSEKDRILFNRELVDNVECDRLYLLGVHNHEDGEDNADVYLGRASAVIRDIDVVDGVSFEEHQTEVIAVDLDWEGWQKIYPLKTSKVKKNKKTKRKVGVKTRKTTVRKPKDHETHGFFTTMAFPKIQAMLGIPTTHLSSNNPQINTLQRAVPHRKAREYSVMELELDTGELTLK